MTHYHELIRLLEIAEHALSESHKQSSQAQDLVANALSLVNRAMAEHCHDYAGTDMNWFVPADECGSDGS